jgi:hypothetical protein
MLTRKETNVFRKFFSALAALTGNVEALAASLGEANQRFRHNVLGEGNGDLPLLELSESEEPARLGRKKAAAK